MAVSSDGGMKKKLLSGRPVFGTFVKSDFPGIAEMLGYAGFDFLIIDQEHAAYSYGAAEQMIRACEAGRIASIVRMPSPDHWHIHHALESGATGVQIPSIETIEETAKATRETAFWPEGTRSPNPSVRAGHYGLWSGEESYIELTKKNSICIVQVESAYMVEHISELCGISQIDVLFIGPGDLSMSMGKPGKLDDPEVVAVIEDVITKGLAGGKVMGMLCGNPAAVKKYIDLGVRYIAYSSDVSMMAGAFRKTAADIFSPYRV
jgi:4-hydroxy-2-oxoheptanedioate aldolase